MAARTVTKECDVVMIGKTGSGKSSLGNSLLHIRKKKQFFKIGKALNSETTRCLRKRKSLDDGTLLSIVDTPGLFNTETPNHETVKEIVKSIGLCTPGPHVILFVLSMKRFTEEEINLVEILKGLFGVEALKHFIVVFTGKDVLYKTDDYEDDDDDDDDDDSVTTMDSFVKNGPEYLQNFMEEINWRFAGIANPLSATSHKNDVQDVMKLIYKTMEENGNQVYSQEAFLRAEQYNRKSLQKEDRD